MHLQFVSDLHLEYQSRYPFIPRVAPHIALLGDIGRPSSSIYQRFISNLSKRFVTVIIIAGNHEYYCQKNNIQTVGQIQAQIESLCSNYSNVHFLENRALTIEGVRILGMTLWTDIPKELWRLARKKMQDYHLSYIDCYPEINVGVPLAPEHTSAWHNDSIRWLKEELAAPGYQNTPIIVLTHHAPYHIGTSDERFSNGPLQCCYSTDLSPLFHRPIIAWAYGHTHYPFDKKIGTIRLASNPYGYPNELSTSSQAITQPKVFIS
jgi:predicted phosphodiesterase|uniref:Calcineurin-like phosphoesterase domain-containing protein n=1 Tax=viral metagenome TaxID=1070528 RepID=A0A6C0IX57_9ZZZZ